MTAYTRKMQYNRIKSEKENDTWTKKRQKGIISEENDILKSKWKDYILQNKSMAGMRTKNAIIPIWDEWLNRTHGNISFRLIQIMTGHGIFDNFLYKIQRAN